MIEQLLTEELYNRLKECEDLPLDSTVRVLPTVTPELKERPLTTVEVVHAPLESDPNRIEITIGLGTEYLQRLLDALAEANREA